MTCDIKRMKRSYEEVFDPSKHQRLETSLYTENMENLTFSTNDDCSTVLSSLTNDLYEPQDSSNHVISTCDDESSFSNSSCDLISAKDYLNTFFNELELSNFPTHLDLLDESLPATSITHTSDEMQSINPPTVIEPANVISPTKSSKLIVFEKELSDLTYLTLKLHNRQYYVYIYQFTHNGNEKVSTKCKIIMDINSWYEFQYKLFAFNLRYKSSSFIANNTILVLNSNNSVMHIKHLKNFSNIELSDYQLEKLKEIAYDLNKELIQHMYAKHLPYLIKKKCTLDNITSENELELMSKLLFSIEENMLTILNRIYECSGCIFHQNSQSLHSCFMFNNREKFQQLGDMILMLVDIDFVVSVFSNTVDCINQNFLCKINVENIKNVLFKTF